MDMKQCFRCKEEKPFTEFYRDKRSKGGLYSYCKKCNHQKGCAYAKTTGGREAQSRSAAKLRNRGYFHFGNGAIQKFKSAEKRHGVTVNLTVDTLKQWWNGNPDICHYCKMDLNECLALADFILSYAGDNNEIGKFKRFYRSPAHRKIRHMTIDRVDNKRGYSIDNMVKACWICNSLKSDFFTGKQMERLAPEIMETLKREIEIERTRTRSLPLVQVWNEVSVAEEAV